MRQQQKSKESTKDGVLVPVFSHDATEEDGDETEEEDDSPRRVLTTIVRHLCALNWFWIVFNHQVAASMSVNVSFDLVQQGSTSLTFPICAPSARVGR